MALIRWSKSLKAVGLIKIILFLFRRFQNKRVNLWNIGKTALKFWVLSIGKSGLNFEIEITDFFVRKEERKRISTLKYLSFFSFYSQRLTSVRPLLEEILFGFPGAGSLNWDPLWEWISQRWKSFLDFMFYRKFRIPDFKIKIQIRNS